MPGQEDIVFISVLQSMCFFFIQLCMFPDWKIHVYVMIACPCAIYSTLLQIHSKPTHEETREVLVSQLCFYFELKTIRGKETVEVLVATLEALCQQLPIFENNVSKF